MRTTIASTVILLLSCAVLASPANAQKGMGEPAGVGRQPTKPEPVSLAGKVLATETGPCEKTTGRALVGAHFLLKTPEGKTLNIHLGPAAAVHSILDQLPLGKKVAVQGFRTTRMPENHYVAQSLTVDGATIQLRDESLRPFWAQGGGFSRGGRGGPQWARGSGQGTASQRWPRHEPGWAGPGRGYGRSGGRGWYGRGPRWGGGWGYGRGRGWGSGRR